MLSRIICWYSDGAASAIAMKLAKEKFGEIHPVYCATNSEHPDNYRFRAQVEAWLGVEIENISSDKFIDVDDVFDRTGWLRGPDGARCTVELSKQDCLGILSEAGIEIPAMYRLGFNNNNCIGCVKAESPNYWNKIRALFPEVFERRAKQERKVNYALTRYRKKPIFLDELPPDLKTNAKEKINCDFLCGGPNETA